MVDEIAFLVEQERAARIAYLDLGNIVFHRVQRKIETGHADDPSPLPNGRTEADHRFLVRFRKIDFGDHDILTGGGLFIPSPPGGIKIGNGSLFRAVNERLIGKSHEEIPNAVPVGKRIRHALHILISGKFRLPGAGHRRQPFLFSHDDAVDLTGLMSRHLSHFLFHSVHEDLIDDPRHNRKDQNYRCANQRNHSLFQIHFLFISPYHH